MQNYNKLIMALFSAAGAALSTGYLTGDVQKWFTFGILIAGTFLIYWFPNIAKVSGLPELPGPERPGGTAVLTDTAAAPDGDVLTAPEADDPNDYEGNL